MTRPINTSPVDPWSALRAQIGRCGEERRHRIWGPWLYPLGRSGLGGGGTSQIREKRTREINAHDRTNLTIQTAGG